MGEIVSEKRDARRHNATISATSSRVNSSAPKRGVNPSPGEFL